MIDLDDRNIPKEILDMLSKNLSNLLLYVPFNHEYPATETIRTKLTTDEFFTKCYYDPKFDEEIKRLQNLSDETSADLDYPITRKSMIEKLQRYAGDERRLITWIQNDDTGVYCVAGDAGTGKSTFLHHLEFNLPQYKWHFLDLQRAVPRVAVMEYSIEIPRFSRLISKILAIMIQELTNELFIYDDTRAFNYAATKSSIKGYLRFYRQNCQKLHPQQQVSVLYRVLASLPWWTSARNFSLQAAEIFSRYFYDVLSRDKEGDALSYILEHYLIYLWYKNGDAKNLIVVDNLERYIGTDEIYNDQIIDFFGKLRGIRDTYSETYRSSVSNKPRFARHFQFMVAMRNTTIRMFTPQQNADFLPHKIDISDWFSLDEILARKIAWYQENNIMTGINDDDRLLYRLNYILTDQGCTGEVLRGLRLKLNMLFNNDKRLITDFLINTLADVNNAQCLKCADLCRETTTVNESLRKFAYRSIIWRLVFDGLCKGEWMQSVFTCGKQGSIAELDYVRKILTILSNHALEQPEGGMALEELLSYIYPGKASINRWFYKEGCELERTKIAKALFAMNYYERRKNNWFQFIDVQCNSSKLNEEHIKDAECFKTKVLRPDVSDEITIKITTSGKAFLGYIVHSFEFISCICGNEDPLLTTLPTADDLLSHDVDSLQCIVIARNVLHYSKLLCQRSATEYRTGHEVPYRKTRSDHGSLYVTRIRHAHQGFLNNFSELLNETITSNNPRIVSRKRTVLEKIKEIRLEYDMLGIPEKSGDTEGQTS